jgi:hypothetical protein
VGTVKPTAPAEEWERLVEGCFSQLAFNGFTFKPARTVNSGLLFRFSLKVNKYFNKLETHVAAMLPSVRTSSPGRVTPGSCRANPAVNQGTVFKVSTAVRHVGIQSVPASTS